MEQFQQKTEAIFTRLTMENALDRQDWDEALRMSRRLDRMTVERLQTERRQATVTA